MQSVPVESGGHMSCCTTGRQGTCDIDSVCTCVRRSEDAIVYLVQHKHSSYDTSHDAASNLRRSVGSLVRHYSALGEADLLLWHEGDWDGDDVAALGLPAHVNT